ncbi:hypothetical protein [Parvularcula marina]|uniref:Uncharacterized protein n=1 Tax=Parvularcula marina TaxID=2292771 RepID=A0A371REC8_9PROT|nr:hypothetical protein [Parvularcula marina]RFB03805.1 hypothetical protein DX908_00025 [Parvularcula marina]
MKRSLLLLPAIALLTGCGGKTPDPQQTFFDNVSVLCGKAFNGRLVSNDEVDAPLAAEPMVMYVRDCSDTEIRIPFIIGENRSRTWVITKSDDSLTLKHIHRHEDGEEDVLSNYGGTTDDEGKGTRQNFPADQFSKDLFIREDIPQSADNVWAIEIIEGEKFAYELTRPERFFRVEFDLLSHADIPPPVWGEEQEKTEE